MSRVAEPAPVLRVCSVLTGTPRLADEAADALAAAFGPVALRSEPFPFDLSDYYRAEMGDGILRTWLCFERLCGADGLVAYREATGALEDAFAVGGRRRVNLDPGYLDHGKLVLASLKEAPDKIYLGRGVWAHTCLRYRFGGFAAPDHSFPDFRDGRFDAFFREAKRLYGALLSQRRATAKEDP